MGVSTAHKHVHNQEVAAKEWTVVHSLNTQAPIVDVMIDTANGLQKIIPLEIIVLDARTVKIVFSSARTGKVSVL